jgi:Protein of unknown function (DUF1569)
MSIFDNGKRQKIIDRINQLTPENQAAWGRMNVNQMICHCADQLRACSNEFEKKSDESNLMSRTLIKSLVLYVVQIPKDVPTSPMIDQVAGKGTQPVEFENDRKTLLEYLEKVVLLPKDFPWASHFKFGKMNRQEWGILSYKHLDHHLRQFGV